MDPPTPTHSSKNLRAHVDFTSPLTSPLTSPVRAPQHPSSPFSSPPNVLPLIQDIFGSIDDREEEEEEEEDIFVSTEGGRGEHGDVLGATLNKSQHSHTRIKQKLKIVFDALRDVRWSISQFLEACVRETDPGGRAIMCDIGGTLAQRQAKVAQAISNPFIRALDVPTVTTIREELRALIQTPYYGQFDHISVLERLNFNNAFQTVEAVAPVWHKLLLTLMSNQRVNRKKNYPKPNIERMSRQIFTITSIICSSQASKNSNFFPSLVDIYLVGSGVKRRVIETLSGFGICHSYKTASSALTKIAESARAYLKTDLASDPHTIFCWDNINWKETVRDARLGHTDVMKAMTTAVIIKCPDIPRGGLLQAMHNPYHKLSIKDILLAPAISGKDDTLGVDITRGLLVDAIRRVHGPGVDSIYPNHDYPRIPTVDRLPAQKTEYWQFGAIPEDEGSIAGTYRVHDNIFLSQLGLSAPADPTSTDEDSFKTRLYLCHGDQLTAHHNRAIRNRQCRAARPYDRKEWLLPVPAWFHIHLNQLLTIVRTHFSSGAGQKTNHSLQEDMAAMGRNACSRENIQYHIFAPLVAQTFTTRVLAMLYTAMQRRGYLSNCHPTDFEKSTGFDKELAKRTPAEFMELIEDIHLLAFTKDAWDGKYRDPEFTTMCRLVQEIELFLAVGHAVKYGDIGLLRRFVDPLIIQFAGAHQWNYTYEMLYYRWLLSPANSPELQRCIQSSGLVNWHGAPHSFKAVDLGLEHLNGSCKINLKVFKNSTHNADIVFDRICLTNTWVNQLRTKVEREFGEYMPGTHTTHSTAEDMYQRARNLQTEAGGASPRPKELLIGVAYSWESPDIHSEGVMLLWEKVQEFNTCYTRRKGIGPTYDSIQGSLDGENTEGGEGIDRVEPLGDSDARDDIELDPTVLTSTQGPSDDDDGDGPEL